MENNNAKALLDKYKSGQLSEVEKAQLDAWYKEISRSNNLVLEDGELDRNLDEVWQMINENIGHTSKSATIKLWPRIAVAVAVVVMLGVWLYYPSSRQSVATRDLLTYANDIAPGKNTATLSLADGKIITLDTSKTSVVVADSVKIATMLTASTPRGGTYQVILPDGTKVWLNAASSIRFPSKFMGKERVVELQGEAYLEVAKDKAHPFIVESNGQQVEVLGTHFNINAYPEEGNTKTTLMEGSVAVRYADLRQDDVVLKPNQQSIITGSEINVKTIDPKETIAWKDGYFRFNDEKIESIMRKVSRWYNVDIEYQGEITKEGFNGAITRYSSIRDVLEIMEGSKAVHFKIEGRRIIVSN